MVIKKLICQVLQGCGWFSHPHFGFSKKTFPLKKNQNGDDKKLIIW